MCRGEGRRDSQGPDICLFPLLGLHSACPASCSSLQLALLALGQTLSPPESCPRPCPLAWLVPSLSCELPEGRPGFGDHTGPHHYSGVGLGGPVSVC